MATTSLKLPQDIKELALAAARQQGITVHAFMVDAIRAAAVAAQRREAFVADATRSRTQTLQLGTGYPADDVHAYLRARAEGKKEGKPKTKPWRS